MEENQEKSNLLDEDSEKKEEFSDFDDDDNQIVDIKRDIEVLDNLEKEAENQEKQESVIEQELSEEKNEKNLISEENPSQEETELSQWEELDKNNAVVKKYIVYIARDFIPYIDNLSTDERSAYINDAIQIKMDLEDEKKLQNKKRKLFLHLIVSILTFCIMTPIALLGVNKAILVTFENYKYSQDNFEKLYKQRFQKNKAYMRSVQYNKEHNTK